MDHLFYSETALKLQNKITKHQAYIKENSNYVSFEHKYFSCMLNLFVHA